jgi:hypothetical protein
MDAGASRDWTAAANAHRIGKDPATAAIDRSVELLADDRACYDGGRAPTGKGSQATARIASAAWMATSANTLRSISEIAQPHGRHCIMKKETRKLAGKYVPGISGAALALLLGFGTPLGANADEKDAMRLIKAMSDYLAAQKAISFAYDANLEVVTAEKQKLALASSGAVTLQRPNKIRAVRSGGFADVELLFDGKTLTLLGKNANRYSQLEVPGTIDHLIDELKDTYNRPLPAADLLLTNVHDELMRDVVDVKDIGSGVIGGVECDHLAFRNKDVDWQIWIAQGNRPYPCRYVITSTLVEGGPQYSVQIRDWKTGSAVSPADFEFKNSTNATKMDFKDLPDTDELPKHFQTGADK